MRLQARGETDAAVIALVLAHVAAAHPDLAGSETADDIPGWIELLQTDLPRWRGPSVLACVAEQAAQNRISGAGPPGWGMPARYLPAIVSRQTHPG